MRNIPFFSILIITVFLLSVNISAHSQDNVQENSEYGFSMGILSGVVYGQAVELVYPSNTKGKYLSELLWDMKPVFYMGLQADFNRVNLMSKPGFFASASFKVGFPGDTGKMEDRDWQSTVNDALTNFSSHTNKTREFFWADLLIGASLPVKSYFYIKPFLSVSRMHFAFTGRDGYKKYARTNGSEYFPIGDNPDYAEFEGDVIRYKQDWILAAAGFSAGTNFLSPFSFELFFQISPLTYCVAKDDHLHSSKKITFNDFTLWGLFIEPKVRIGYTLKNMDFSIEGLYRYIGDTKGPSYVNANIYQSGEAGAALSVYDIRLIIKFIF